MEAYNTNPLRQFSFTIQDEQLDLESLLNCMEKDGLPSPIDYLKVAKEEGGDTENVHYHLFLHGNKGERYSFYVNLFKVHLSDCKIYNVKQTLDYIGNPGFLYSENHSIVEKRGKPKGGTVHKVWEMGDIKNVKIPKKGSGGNTLDDRLEKIQDLIKSGSDLTELYNSDFGVMIRYSRSIENYLSVHHRTAKIKIGKHQEEKENENITRDV